jgi:hypothetical protein
VLITLSNAMTRKLAALPEAGMGYQCVDADLRDGRRLEGVMVLRIDAARRSGDRRQDRLRRYFGHRTPAGFP